MMSSTKELPKLHELFDSFADTDIYCNFVEKVEKVFFEKTVNLEEVVLEFKAQELQSKDNDVYAKYLDFEYFQVIGYQLLPYIHCTNPLDDKDKYLESVLSVSDGNKSYVIQNKLCDLHNLFSSWCKQEYGKSPSEIISLMI